MSFTKEELAAAGWDPLRDWQAVNPLCRCDECLIPRIRLALAHPERAAEALGEGWSVAPVARIATWSMSAPGGIINLDVFRTGRIGQSLHTDHGEEGSAILPELPPEFDAALARARKIAAAWERIQQT